MNISHNRLLATLPPMSSHDRLMRDLLMFIEDASNQFADDCHDHMARRADELFVRIERQLGE